MKNKVDWLNHSLEFFVVIVGILIAFQLNKCSSENEHRQIVDNHLSQIIEETEFNKNSIERAISHSTSNILKLDSIIDLLSTGTDFPKINQLSLELLNIGGVYLRKNAYQTLIESGDIRYMKNFTEKNNTINLYEYYKWVDSFNDISMNLYTSDYYPYLKENFDLVNGQLQDEDVYQSKLFQNILSAYLRTSQNRHQKYQDCLVEINGYLQKVKQQD